MGNEKWDLYNELKAQGYVFTKSPVKYTLEELQQLAASKPAQAPAPTAEREQTELPGQRQNTKAPDEPLRVDPDTGHVWFQEEVRKPGTAAPRGRRVLTVNDPGTRTVTTSDGRFTETFEVAGDQQGVQTTIKITLPSYQVGIYKNPKMPFKIHCYAGKEAFDRHEVNKFYGGAELVPKDIKRVYVANSLGYDIRTTIQAIQAEDRRNQLSRGARLS